MKRKILAVLAIMFCLSNQTISTQAATVISKDSGVTVVEYTDVESRKDFDTTKEIHVLTDGNGARNVGVPIKGWDLSKHDYVYRLNNLTDEDSVYTLYLFSPDENGCISISTNGLNSGGKNVTIKLQRSGLIIEHLVASWTGNPQSIQGLGFNNLDPDEAYYFIFRVESGGVVNGTGVIHHP